MREKGMAVLARLRELPGGPQLLELAACRDDVELVGGAARDLLLGVAPRELDVIVDCGAKPFAARIASIIDSRLAADGVRCGIDAHERFGTALVWWDGARIDVAARRAESYSAPGALPEVRPGTPDEDLRRRDFTVNAIAVALGGSRRGELRAVSNALEDLAASRLRVLHDDSFTDDPTRLLRLARYSARLGFQADEHTAALAADAVAAGALATLSGARFGAELRLALAEPDPVAALQALDGLGALAALDPALQLDAALARAALAALPALPDGRAEELLLALLLLGVAERGEAAPRALLDRLEFGAGERDRVARSATLAPALSERLERARTPSQLYEAAHDAPLEAVALAAALAERQGREEAAEAARRWLSELRNVRLEITGEDLLGAGVVAGPELGRRLRRALQRKLDGELAEGREAELAAALEEL